MLKQPPLTNSFQRDGRFDEAPRVAPGAPGRVRRPGRHPDVTLHGGVRGTVRQVGHHGQGEAQVHWVAGAPKVKVRTFVLFRFQIK